MQIRPIILHPLIADREEFDLSHFYYNPWWTGDFLNRCSGEREAEESAEMPLHSQYTKDRRQWRWKVARLAMRPAACGRGNWEA